MTLEEIASELDSITDLIDDPYALGVLVVAVAAIRECARPAPYIMASSFRSLQLSPEEAEDIAGIRAEQALLVTSAGFDSTTRVMADADNVAHWVPLRGDRDKAACGREIPWTPAWLWMLNDDRQFRAWPAAPCAACLVAFDDADRPGEVK